MAQQSLARSSLTMVGGSLASRVLGTVRAGLLTAIIGAQAAGDAFSLANTLPNVLYVLAAGGILNAVLIPALSRAMKLEDGGQEFTDRVITVAVTGMLVLTALVTAGAGFFVWLLAGSRSPEFKDLAVAFSLICLPQIFFYGLFALLGQILNAKGRFGAFAWAPFLANVVAVAGLLVFIVLFPAPHLTGPRGQPLPRPPELWTGPMIWLFAGSATLSVVVQALWLVPALRRSGFTYRPRWGLRGVGLGGVSRLALWAFAGLAVSQLGFFITQAALNQAASHGPRDDPVRGPAVYAIAFTIFMLPHAFVTVSIITALFPRLAAASADGDVARLKADYRRGLVLPLVANVPVMVFVMVAAEPIVTLLNPGVDRRSLEVAAVVLVVMILGIVPFGVDLLCYRLLFAEEDGRSPFRMQVALTSVTLLAGALTLVLDPRWAVGVLAFGQTIGNVVSSSIGVWTVRRRLGPLGLSQVVDAAARVGVAAAAAGLLAWGTMTVVSPILDDPEGPRGMSVAERVFSNAFAVGLVGLVFAAVYLLLAHALHVREVREVADLVRRKVRRTEVPASR
ncbi:MAG TPA: murein biosynthesis integral membrane protein MurJ [Intrasporangium sp.]|uniref:murein biosynthesis integral membrane protein MurJ n=1 Tax=Intrasporangium sp. TaxID=1925024 RepID=UPI002D78F319|nr:murein biosynthesis integral membrane protein MurJ [Intrasporangium sp.]HET7396975.1 murein biosynthesis integral membrane protein MurJ [Intrasporangium sp.]